MRRAPETFGIACSKGGRGALYRCHCRYGDVPPRGDFVLFRHHPHDRRAVAAYFDDFVLILTRFFRIVSSSDYRFVWNDALMPALGLWMVISTCLSEDVQRGLVFGGSTALEFCMPYFVARSYLTQRGEALATVKVVLYVLAIVGFLALGDWAADRAIIKETLGQFTGYAKVYLMSRYDWRYRLSGRGA